MTPVPGRVAPKPKVQGKTNIAGLMSLMDSRGFGDKFKLKPDGTVRIRVVEPLGKDDLPMVPADDHWIPSVNDEGKETKKQMVCFDIADHFPCPCCVLAKVLSNYKLATVTQLASDLKVRARWAMYVIDRTYMVDMDEPVVDLRKERVAQAVLPVSVARGMLEYLSKRGWGDFTAPIGGYDFEVTGKKEGKKAFTTYTVAPVPKECSPDYDINKTKGFKPISQTVVLADVDAMLEQLEPVLAAIMEQEPEHGEAIIQDFNDAWALAQEEYAAEHPQEEVEVGDAAVEDVEGEDVEVEAAVVEDVAPLREDPQYLEDTEVESREEAGDAAVEDVEAADAEVESPVMEEVPVVSPGAAIRPVPRATNPAPVVAPAPVAAAPIRRSPAAVSQETGVAAKAEGSSGAKTSLLSSLRSAARKK